MKMLAPLLLLVFLALAVEFLPRSAVSYAGENAAVPGATEFAVKIVRVYTSCPEEGSGYILKDVSLVAMAGRTILVGTCVDTGREGDWTAGLRAGISWDKVTMYYALTPQQYQTNFIDYYRDAE